MAEAFEPIREINAIRLMLQDETKGMSTAERVEHYNKEGRAILAKHGLDSRIVNLSGQGKLKPRMAVANITAMSGDYAI
jgi:hypothetical protein